MPLKSLKPNLGRPKPHPLAWGLGTVAVAGILIGMAFAQRQPEPAEPKPPLPEFSVLVAAPREESKVNPQLAKYEPETGCYLGAYIDLADELKEVYVDRTGKNRKFPFEFEEKVNKEHAMYFFYLGYGQEVPMDWLQYLALQDKFVHIALEPNQGLDRVKDDIYLRRFADDLYASGAKVFLRFASEMNGPWTNYHGDPELYIEKWRLLTQVMRDRAPNVAMVWCPYTTPETPIATYYPGDEWVDWVGVNMYSVSFFNQRSGQPAFHVKPRELLEFVYDEYSDRKPIMIGEYGTSHYSALESAYLIDYAVNNLESLYGDLETRFPRVKAINYFNTNNLKLQHRQNNNYSVTHNEEVLDAYQLAVSSPHFLSRQPEGMPCGPGLSTSVLQHGTVLSGRPHLGIYVPGKSVPGRVQVTLDKRVVYSGPDPSRAGFELDLTGEKPREAVLKVDVFGSTGNLRETMTVPIKVSN